MPLVVIVGSACTGKTTRCKELKEYLQGLGKKVEVICDPDDKNGAYRDSKNEKDTRGKVKSGAQRVLDKNTYVIIDSTNYIKGFRYELFRVARTLDTTNCVIYCKTPLETCLDWNKKTENPWEETILKEMFNRIEEPNENNRWDKPTFVVGPTDKLQLNEIEETLSGFKERPRQEVSELPQLLSDTNLLYELEQITNDIVSTIISSQNVIMCGDYIVIKGTSERIVMPQRINISELRTIRSQFVKFSELHPPNNVKDIPKHFVIFLNSKLK